ncbi:MAG: putative hydrolase of the superfamily [Acidimicrobiaceae bacterium]|jgi:putative hydrolase of the HAD superfamily
MSDIDALIVDLDGVIRHWHGHELTALAESVGLTRDDLGEIAFEPELLAAAMTGAVVFEDWADEIGRRAGALHGCDAATITAGWAALGWTLDHEVLDLLREVRAAARAKVALFSNASTRLEADLESCSIDTEFDVVFNSARLGIAKPDIDAFATVAKLLGVPVERCLFVDDTVPNVEGARAAGMQAEPFTDVGALRTLLERAGLLDGAAAS